MSCSMLSKRVSVYPIYLSGPLDTFFIATVVSLGGIESPGDKLLSVNLICDSIGFQVLPSILLKI